MRVVEERSVPFDQFETVSFHDAEIRLMEFGDREVRILFEHTGFKPASEGGFAEGFEGAEFDVRLRDVQFFGAGLYGPFPINRLEVTRLGDVTPETLGRLRYAVTDGAHAARSWDEARKGIWGDVKGEAALIAACPDHKLLSFDAHVGMGVVAIAGDGEIEVRRPAA